jgi:hypothetical protein
VGEEAQPRGLTFLLRQRIRAELVQALCGLGLAQAFRLGLLLLKDLGNGLLISLPVGVPPVGGTFCGFIILDTINFLLKFLYTEGLKSFLAKAKTV